MIVMELRKKMLIPIGIAAAVVLGIFIWIIIKDEKAMPTFSPTPYVAPEEFENISHPADTIPETNPFKKSENPIEKAYRNPFD